MTPTLLKKFSVYLLFLLLFPFCSSDKNNTALHLAVIGQQRHMTAYLIQLMRQQGISLDKRNSESKTAADLAKGTLLENIFISAFTHTLFFSSGLNVNRNTIPINSDVEYKPMSKL